MGVQCRVCRRPFRLCTGSHQPLADGQLRVGQYPRPWGTFRPLPTVESIFSRTGSYVQWQPSSLGYGTSSLHGRLGQWGRLRLLRRWAHARSSVRATSVMVSSWSMTLWKGTQSGRRFGCYGMSGQYLLCFLRLSGPGNICKLKSLCSPQTIWLTSGTIWST